MDLNFDFFSRIKLKELTRANILAFSKAALKIQHITNCYQVMGDDTDFMIRSVVDSVATYHDKIIFVLYETGLVERITECSLLSILKEDGLYLENIQNRKN
jgi:hypothetical protein